MTREEIEKRIAELEAERETLVQQANAALARLTGAIEELRRWLEQETE